MKTITSYFFLTVLIAGFITTTSQCQPLTQKDLQKLASTMAGEFSSEAQ